MPIATHPIFIILMLISAVASKLPVKRAGKAEDVA